MFSVTTILGCADLWLRSIVRIAQLHRSIPWRLVGKSLLERLRRWGSSCRSQSASSRGQRRTRRPRTGARLGRTILPSARPTACPPSQTLQPTVKIHKKNQHWSHTLVYVVLLGLWIRKWSISLSAHFVAILNLHFSFQMRDILLGEVESMTIGFLYIVRYLSKAAVFSVFSANLSYMVQFYCPLKLEVEVVNQAVCHI